MKSNCAMFLFGLPVIGVMLVAGLCRAAESGPPELALETTVIQAVVPADDTSETNIVFRNTGGQPMAWSITRSPRWAEPEETRGKLNPGDSLKLIIYIHGDDMPEGLQTGNIVLDAPGAKNAPITIPLKITVGENAIVNTPAANPSPTTTPVPEPKPNPVGLEPKPNPVGMPDVSSIPVVTPRMPVFGLRLGLLMPGNGKIKKFNSSPMLGLSYRMSPFQNRSISLEAILDIGRSTSADASTKSIFVIGTAAVLYRPLSTFQEAYVLGGLQVLRESYQDDANNESGTASAPMICLGAGYSLWKNRLDIRLSYLYLAGGDNVPGFMKISTVYRF